ncbi:MAG: hypothetical protein ACXAEU_11250 [Candidatus Hodarchaeales archaeon]
MNLSTLTYGAACESAEPLTGKFSFYLWSCIAEDPCTLIITVIVNVSNRDRLFMRCSAIDPLEDHGFFLIDFCLVLTDPLFYNVDG